MKFFEENYSHELPTRIKNLRKKHNITQSELSNAGQVSQVEKEKQQVTTSILLYLNTQTDLDYKEIIFGDIVKLVENMFYHCFGSILFRDLETVNKRMNSLSDDDLISIQSSCLRLSKTFANFNIQRKKFLISDETEKIIHNGKKVIKKSKKINQFQQQWTHTPS
ncbi:XRE family transcriptional regulator [Streptococcus pseudopneumoniae]|nr:XRE family transcriptional regulator [Streptococcus pseudopneumoniae]